MRPGKRPQTIATKVLLPRCDGLIERPRLLELVTHLQKKRLCLVKAPAGFGKTSLAVAWANRLLQSGNSVAWLSLDPSDNQSTRFLFYVSQALQRACDGLGGPAIVLILETSLISPQAILSTLINGLAEIDEEVCLFLEDFHWVSDPTIHEAVAFLLRHAPSQFHLVLVTRIEPPLPLAGLRAQNQLLEVDSAALRFDLEETRQFLEHEGLGPLDPAQLRLLHERTEGWPAVLRITASISSQSGQNLGHCAGQLSGTLRPIGAYLAEMLDGIPRDMALFMLRTAVLDRFSAPLCQAVTQHKSSRDFLESIANRQLLLVPLDHDGSWYRYHTLLSAYLRRRLEFTGEHRTGTPRRNYGPKRSSIHRCRRHRASSKLDQELRHGVGEEGRLANPSWLAAPVSNSAQPNGTQTGDCLGNGPRNPHRRGAANPPADRERFRRRTFGRKRGACM